MVRIVRVGRHRRMASRMWLASSRRPSTSCTRRQRAGLTGWRWGRRRNGDHFEVSLNFVKIPLRLDCNRPKVVVVVVVVDEDIVKDVVTCVFKFNQL